MSLSHNALGANPDAVVTARDSAPAISFQTTVRVTEGGERFAADLPSDEPKTRPELTVPISPVAELSDTVLYEDAAVPDRRYYLPRYRLAEETVSGRQQYRIALRTRGPKWAFTVVLEKFPAAEIQLAARTASELPHDPEIVLTHRLFMDGVATGVKERVLSEVEALPNGIQATVTLDGLEDRDEVYRALTESTYATNLEVRRRLRAAVPVPAGESGIHIVSRGAIELKQGDGFDVVAGAPASDRAHFHWVKRWIAPDGPVEMAALGPVPIDGVTLEQLRNAPYASKPLQCAAVPGPDARLLITSLWNPPAGGGGVYVTHPQGVWYTGSQWSIFNQNLQAMQAPTAYVVVAAPGAALHHTEATHLDWDPWTPLDAPRGGWLNSPSVVCRSPGVCIVYVRGSDNALWHRPFYGGEWHPWVRHADSGLIEAPAADSIRADHERVFVQGTDGGLHHKEWTATGGWGGWIAHGMPPGGFVGRPATVSRNPDVCNVYVRGADNALWQLPFYNGQWQGWARHDDGGLISSPPAVGSFGPDHEHVYARGLDGQLYGKFWVPSAGWSGWGSLAAPPPGFSGGAVAVTRGPNICSVHVRGNDNGLWHRLWTGDAWLGWTRDAAAPPLADDPAGDSMQPGQEGVFIRAADGQLWEKRWTGVQKVGNVNGNWTSIDHPALNGNSHALCQVTQNWNPPDFAGVYNPHHVGVWYYDSISRWAIYNQDMADMPLGTSFNVRVTPASPQAFLHRAAPDNIQGHITIIRNPLLDGLPDKKLLVTPNWNPGGGDGVYNNHAIGVFFTGANWSIYNQDIAPMPPNASFNVEIVEGSEASVHVAVAESNSGNVTLLTIPVPEGSISNNHVVSIKTDDQHFAKLLIGDCRSTLSLQWVTFSDAPRYREQAASLDLARLRESWLFPPSLYGYVYRGIDDVGGGGGGLVRHSVEWQGAQHPYYQDGTRRQTFYYLPDGFKVARKNTPRRTPDITIRVGSPDGSLEKTAASIAYLAVAVTDPHRLSAAKDRLRAVIGSEVGEPVFEPLRPQALTFKLGLPRPQSTAVAFVEQPDALLTMTSLRHSVELPLEPFQAVFEALFTQSSLIFQGQIEVKLGEEVVPPMPFQARISDLAGDPVVCTVSRAAEAMTATLRNVIESPVRIHDLAVTLVDGTKRLPAVVEGLTLPADLAASQQVVFTVRPAAASVPAGADAAEFDFRQVEVIPDRAAVFDAVIDTTTTAEYLRNVGVRTVREVFHGEEPKVTLIRVNLKRGDSAVVSVDLAEDHLGDVARLRSPLRDYILGRADRGEFQYQLVVVRGGMRTTTAYKPATSDLIITTEDFV